MISCGTCTVPLTTLTLFVYRNKALEMSDDNPNRPRTLGGGNANEPFPTSRPSGSSGSRIGRIGGWGGGGSTACVTYRITTSINISDLSFPLRAAVVDVASLLSVTTAMMMAATMNPRTTLPAAREGMSHSNLYPHDSFSLRVSSFQRDKCPEPGQGTRLLWSWPHARSPRTRTQRSAT